MCCETAVVSQFKNISLRPAEGNDQLPLNVMKLMRTSDLGRTATPAASEQVLAVPDKPASDLQRDDHSPASV